MAHLTQVPGCQPSQGPWLSSLAGGEGVNCGAGRGCPLRSGTFLAEWLTELPAHNLEEDNNICLARDVGRGRGPGTPVTLYLQILPSPWGCPIVGHPGWGLHRWEPEKDRLGNQAQLWVWAPLPGCGAREAP